MPNLFLFKKLEFYLRVSGLVDLHALEQILGDGGNQIFQSLQSKRKNGFSTRTLARLAYLSTRHVEAMALEYLDVSFDAIDEKRYITSRKCWLFNFAIFDTYAKKKGSSLKVSLYPSLDLAPEINKCLF